MIRVLAAILLLLPGALAAQEKGGAVSAPLLKQEMELTEAVPGQPLTLRLTVLVPSYMPKPPVWPAFSTPDVMVRVPERGTGPVTQRVNGESWSGISRRYEVTPLAPGTFVLRPADLTVTWADPDSNAPRTAVLTTGEIRLSGVVPAAAAGLDPFLAAERLSLDRRIDGDLSALSRGGSASVTVTASVQGVSPLVIPPLIALPEIAGIAAYPDQPRLTETAEGGSRTETVTLVAEAGADGTLPAIRLGWYDLASGTVATAALDAVAIHAEGPKRRWVSPAPMAGLAAALALCTVFGGAILLLARRLRPVWQARAARHRRSEAWAWQALQKTVRQRDYPGLYPALDLWAARRAGPDPRRDAQVAGALALLGAARYGAGGSDGAGWQALGPALAAARRSSHSPDTAAPLPPLNPAS